MNEYQIFGRCYLDLQHLRVAVEARLRRLSEEEEQNVKLLKVLREYLALLKNDEKKLLHDATMLFEEHPLWRWCKAVRGLGPVACLTFLGFIDPNIANTAGKAKAYCGFVPGRELRARQKAKFNPEAKGRFWLLTRNVIMAKDDYYYPLFKNKKDYYMERMGGYLENPKDCPQYEECSKRLKGKAKRLKRKVKKPPCKLHINNKAKAWLSGLLISHGTEIMRKAEGLDVTNFHEHRGYIAPKPF